MGVPSRDATYLPSLKWAIPIREYPRDHSGLSFTQRSACWSLQSTGCVDSHHSRTSRASSYLPSRTATAERLLQKVASVGAAATACCIRAYDSSVLLCVNSCFASAITSCGVLLQSTNQVGGYSTVRTHRVSAMFCCGVGTTRALLAKQGHATTVQATCKAQACVHDTIGLCRSSSLTSFSYSLNRSLHHHRTRRHRLRSARGPPRQ